MIKSIPWKRVFQIGTLLILFAAAFFVGRALPQPLNAQAAAPVQVSVDGSPTLLNYFPCTIVRTGVFSAPAPGRVHVQCSNAINDNGASITFWAFKADDSATASRYLSIFNTALATGRTVGIFYNSGENGSAWGCDVSNCRPIVGATMP